MKSQQQLANLLMQFINAETWLESKRIVEANPVLLTAEALAVLSQLMAQNSDDEQATRVLQEHEQLLARCRTEGIDAAFTDYLQSAGDALEPLLRELQQPARRRDMPRRIALCRQALALVSKDTDTQLWAALQVVLGNSLVQTPLGDRADNYEQAIFAYQEAVNSHQAMIQRAKTMTNLANAYRNRIRGERADNIERAIDLYEQARKAVSRQAMPTEWAQTMNNLASAYRNRIRGEPAANIEQAIDYYKQALQVRHRQAMPVEWARTMINLANSYADRIRGKRAQNIEQAIDLYEQALQVMSRQTMPVEWAQTMNNLATVYADRIHGERATNIEQAIKASQKALEVRTRQAMPVEWAQTMSNLALAYYSRIRGERAANIEVAIHYYKQALEVRTRQAQPGKWARTMMNLANAYFSRIRGEREANIEEAIHYYEKALQVRSRQALPVEWARTIRNLAAAYNSRIRGERAANIEQAIDLYKQALQVMSQQAQPVEWARTMRNLAAAYYFRVRGERADNLQQTIFAYQEALQIQTLMAMPDEHRLTQRNLGNLYFKERNWVSADTAYAAALAASELLYQASGTTEARQLELREVRDLSAHAAYCLAKHVLRDEVLGRNSSAVETLEQGKARALAEAVTRQDAVLKGASVADKSAFESDRKRIRALEAEARAEGESWARDFLTVSADLRQARDELSAVVARIREYVPDFMPEGLDFPAIKSVANKLNQPLVYLLTTLHGSLALIVPPNQAEEEKERAEVEALWRDDFQTDDLNKILYDQDDTQRYLHGTVLGTEIEAFKQVLDEIWPSQLSGLMAPITARLAELGHQQAVLIPMGRLSLLPLHAISGTVDFTLAPSVRALQSALAAASKRATLSPILLGIGNPTANNQKSLPYARLEIEEAAHLTTAANTFYEKGATRQAAVDNLAGATHLHFACHGTFNQNKPLDSALYLAGDDILTLRDLLSGDVNLSAARLAVLSACQSGITDFRKVPDEAIGFPAGFLQAGVPGVISTLWPVDDISTSLLLSRFYGYHLVEGFGPAAALWKAQQWLQNVTAGELKDYFAALRRKPDNERAMTYQQASAAWRRFARQKREEKPFAHPFYWAAFTFTGV